MIDWNAELARAERMVGPEDEFDPEVNGDPSSTLGDDDEEGFDDDPYGDEPDFDGEDDDEDTDIEDDDD